MSAIPRNVLVVIGTGGMGQACVRRLASGRRVFVADFSAKILDGVVAGLKQDGHLVEGHLIDVSSFASVHMFAQTVGAAGHIDAIIHTAGVSPVMAPVRKIYEVDLLGTAHIIEAFLPFASGGTSLVCIASLAGYISGISHELEQHLASAPIEKLLHHEQIDLGSATDTHDAKQAAYNIAKRGNQVRVQMSARVWGARGARINSISPGLVATPMGALEVEGPNKEKVAGLVELSPMRRKGTPEDIANVAAFLAGSESSFITGTDILIDGGAFSAMKWGATD